MKNRIIVVVLALVTTVSAQTKKVSTGESQIASTKLQGIELRGTVPVMFATLLGEAGMPGGVAISNQECSQPPATLLTIQTGTSLDRALEQVATSTPGSQWQLRDGLPNLVPVGPLPAFLLARIPNFRWSAASDVQETLARLRQLPAVSAEISRLGLKEAPIEGAPTSVCVRGPCTSNPSRTTTPGAVENVTLLTALNQIALSQGRAVWMYSEYHCAGDTLFSLTLLAH